MKSTSKNKAVEQITTLSVMIAASLDELSNIVSDAVFETYDQEAIRTIVKQIHWLQEQIKACTIFRSEI